MYNFKIFLNIPKQKVVRTCPACEGNKVEMDDISVKSGKSARSASSRKSTRSTKSGKSTSKGKPGKATQSGRYGNMPCESTETNNMFSFSQCYCVHYIMIVLLTVFCVCAQNLSSHHSVDGDGYCCRHPSVQIAQKKMIGG